MEAQVEVLKKIICHLSKIEKEEAKKDKANREPSELTQEDINRMMAKGKVRLLLPNFMPQRVLLDHGLFKMAYMNDFSESGDARIWEDHNWPKWTSKVGTTQVTPTRFMLESNIDPSSDDNQFLVMNKEKEGDDEMISCWSGDDSD